MTRKELKRWAEPVLVAVTAPKVSLNHDGDVYWWKEYRVRPLSGDDFSALKATGKLSSLADYRPFLIENRRVDGTADRTPTNPWEWGVWGTGETPGELIDEFLGDSLFSAAESLVPEHAELAAYTRDIRAALNAEYEADKVYEDAATAWTRFVRDEQSKYEEKVAGKTDEEAAKIRERTVKRLAPRRDELRSALDDAKAKREAARAAVAAVRKRKPKCGLKPNPARTDRLGC